VRCVDSDGDITIKALNVALTVDKQTLCATVLTPATNPTHNSSQQLVCKCPQSLYMNPLLCKYPSFTYYISYTRLLKETLSFALHEYKHVIVALTSPTYLSNTYADM
jgi:hypothetical protein